MKYLISEIGINHLGDMNKAKEMIRISRECGANLVKSQAFLAKDVALNGSMPFGFYQQCELKFHEYVELIEYGKQIGIPVFFSIFSRSFDDLAYHQDWHKIAGVQVKLGFNNIIKKDTEKTIVSIPEFSLLPPIKKAQVLYVTPYMCEEPRFAMHGFLESYYNKPVGMSCHCTGIEPALRAIKDLNIPILEKHFTLTRDIKYKGQTFRDCLHAADPNELTQLAGELN